MIDGKQVPRGCWLHLSGQGFSAETTDEQLSAWFKKRGLVIPPEVIKVKQFPNGRASALLSLPDEVIAQLLGHIIGEDETFNGGPLIIRPWRTYPGHRPTPAIPSEAPLTPSY